MKMNYKYFLLVLLVLLTLTTTACSHVREAPLSGDLGPAGGKVSLNIIPQNSSNISSQNGSEVLNNSSFEE